MTDHEPVASGENWTFEYRHLESIPLHSTNLLTVLDRDGVIQYESPSITQIFGFEQRDLIGEEVAAYIHPEDRETVLEAFQEIVSGDDRGARVVEYRHKCADGSWQWSESVGSSETNSAGHFVVNTRDVSAFKRRESRLERQKEQLDRFASLVSHDLRSPLQVATGNLELFVENGENEHIETAMDALDRMDELIEDLLVLSRRGDEIGEQEPVSLAALAKSCWNNVESNESSLQIESDVTINADRSRLQQLLENLLRNAIEHNENAVTVWMGGTEDGLYVEDDGEGIPPERRTDVFESGYTSVDEGTGVGLNIVKQVVDAHGWDIQIGEGRDGGARFEITGASVGAK